MSTILYLDFDGVLHDNQVYFHPRRGIYMNKPGRRLFEWMSILDDLLAPHPQVGIVLSTNWVRLRCVTFVKKHLSPFLQERIVGATFDAQEMEKDTFSMLPRGLQIEQDVLRRAPDAWLAIDDDLRGWSESHRHNLIRTAGAHGISDPAIQAAIGARLSSFQEHGPTKPTARPAPALFNPDRQCENDVSFRARAR